MSKQLKCKTLLIEVNGPTTPWIVIKADGKPLGNVTELLLKASSDSSIYNLAVEQDKEWFDIVVGDAEIVSDSEVNK